MENIQYIKEFLEEAQSHIEAIETGLIKLEAGNGGGETVHVIFRAVHSLKGTAGFFALKNIVGLSHSMESLLVEIRSGRLSISQEIIDILLAANDTLRLMVEDVENSESVDISEHLARISAIPGGRETEAAVTPVGPDFRAVPEKEEAAVPEVEKEDRYCSGPEATGPEAGRHEGGEFRNPVATNRRVLTFYLCGRLFGLDITTVKEINRNIEYTPVPDAPPHIIGLFNMRGQVVTLFDLAGMAGYRRENEGRRSTCIIMKSTPAEPDYIGFLIDRLGSVADIAGDMCEPPPANMGGLDSTLISEVVKLKDELLMVIDRKVLLDYRDPAPMQSDWLVD